MGNNLTITFTNFSQTTFNRDKNGYTIQAAVGQINQWPDTTLQAMGGVQTCAASQNLSKLADGDADIYCCWNNGVWRFGVKIIAPFQMLGMGDRPYWQVMYDQNPDSSTIDWLSSGSNPAYVYDWPSSVGYKIVGTPNSDHSALSVAVEIQNLS